MALLHNVFGVTYGSAAFRAKLLLLSLFFSLANVHAARADVVIAVLGDSLTQGYGLPAEQGLVPQLEAWLTQQGHAVRLINAGVSGDTTAGGLARAAWTLTDDVDGLILALGGNDFLRALPPEMSRANLMGILEVAQERDVDVLLVGFEAPSNYGAAYKESFDALYPSLAEAYNTLLLPSFFAAFGEDPAQFAAFMQNDGIHPNPQGVAQIVAQLGPKVEVLIQKITQE